MGSSESNPFGPNSPFMVDYSVERQDLQHNLLYLSNKQSQEFLLKKYIFNQPITFQNFIQSLEARKSLGEHYLTHLQKYHQTSQEKMCSNYHQVYALWDYPHRNLTQDIAGRKRQLRRYSPDNLWALLRSSVMALAQLQQRSIKHSCLTTDNILVRKGGNYVIGDPMAMGLESNKNQLQKDRSLQGLYLSPQQCEQLQTHRTGQTWSPFRQDIFTLGMITLECGLLQNQNSCYRWSCSGVNEPQLQKHLQKFGEIYPGQLNQIVRSMLTRDARARPDFIELKKIFSENYYYGQQANQQKNIVRQEPKTTQYQYTANRHILKAQKPEAINYRVSAPANTQRTQVNTERNYFGTSEPHFSQFYNTMVVPPPAQVPVQPTPQIIHNQQNNYLFNRFSDKKDGYRPQLDSQGAQKNPIRKHERSPHITNTQTNNQNSVLPQNATMGDLISTLFKQQTPQPARSPSGNQFSEYTGTQYNRPASVEKKEQFSQIPKTNLAFQTITPQIPSIASTNISPHLPPKSNFSAINYNNFQPQSITSQNFAPSFLAAPSATSTISVTSSVNPSVVPPLPKAAYIPGPLLQTTSTYKPTALESIPQYIPVIPSQPAFTQNAAQNNNKFATPVTFQSFNLDVITSRDGPNNWKKPLSINDIDRPISAAPPQFPISSQPKYSIQSIMVQNSQPKPTNQRPFPLNNLVKTVQSKYTKPNDSLNYQLESYIQPTQSINYNLMTESPTRPVHTHNYSLSDPKLITNQQVSSVLVEGVPKYVQQHFNQGGKYLGYKLNGKKHGKGEFYYQDGGNYKGEWRDNKMNGYGVLCYQSERIAYEGSWLNDAFNGRGKLYNEHPVKSTQGFNYNSFDDIDEAWEYYQGQFKSDYKDGWGVLKFGNGQMFEGNFRQDMIDGQGSFHCKDGRVVYGIWKENHLVNVLN